MVRKTRLVRLGALIPNGLYAFVSQHVRNRLGGAGHDTPCPSLGGNSAASQGQQGHAEDAGAKRICGCAPLNRSFREGGRRMSGFSCGERNSELAGQVANGFNALQRLYAHPKELDKD